MVKRGEYKRSNHTDICKCGCGDVTCHFEYDKTKHRNRDLSKLEGRVNSDYYQVLLDRLHR